MQKQYIKKVLIILYSLIKINSINLFCNGNFEECSLKLGASNAALQYQQYDYFASNKSCWYTLENVSYQVLNISSANGTQTKAADFVSLSSYTLCQNITTTPTYIYQLNYTFIYQATLTSGQISALLDRKQITTITYDNINRILKNSVNFTSTLNYHQICFQSSQSYSPLNVLVAITQLSPYIDDVSLEQIYPILVPSSISPSPSQANYSTTSNSTLNTSNNANTTNNSNQTSKNNNSTSNASNSSIKAQNSSFLSTQTQTIYIRFKSQIDYLSNQFTLTSDFNLKSLNLSPSNFIGTIITIKGQIQNKVQYNQNQNGNLVIKFRPEYIIDILNLKYLNVYYPSQLYSLQNRYRFQFIIDGRNVCYVRLSASEYTKIQKVEKIAMQMGSIIYTGYIILNSLSCSYLLISLIGFWNVALMYTFLMIDSLPMFARNFMTKLRDTFFLRGTVKLFVNKIRNYNSNDDLINFDSLQPKQKIEKYKGQFQWFNFVGLSSNSLSNNFDAIVLMSLLVIKFIVAKIVFFFMYQATQIKISFTKIKFFYKFTEQLSCFCPFIIIPAYLNSINMAQESTFPKINSIIQSIFIFSLLLIPGMCFIFKNIFPFSNNTLVSQSRFSPSGNEQNYKSFQNIETFSWFMLCLIIPFFIALCHSVIFFIISTLVILFRFIYTLKNLRNISLRQKLFRTISTTIWVIFQAIFIFYFIIDHVSQQSIKALKDIIKYSGFVVIGCIMIGAIADILDFLIKIIQIGVYLTRKLVNFYKRKKSNNKIQNEHLSQIHNYKQDKRRQISQKCTKQNKNLIRVRQASLLRQKYESNEKLAQMRQKLKQRQLRININKRAQQVIQKYQLNNILSQRKCIKTNKRILTQHSFDSRINLPDRDKNLYKLLIRQQNTNKNLQVISLQDEEIQ